MKPNLIVTGASGLLGQFLCQFFSKNYSVMGVHYSDKPHSQVCSFARIDLTDKDSAKSFFSDYQVEYVIHTAGLASVDLSEKDPQSAECLNVEMTENIVRYLDPLKTKLIHISTDHLFSGENKLYTENCKENPLNIYAKTKLEAEKIVKAADNYIIARTNFYGGATAKKKSFSSWIYQELKKGNKLNLFEDVFFTPLSVFSLADSIEKLMHSELQGTYNVVGDERISKLAFAQQLANIFGLDHNLIKPSKISEAHLRAPRPHDMSLSTDKIKKDLPSFIPENVKTGLLKIKSQNLI